jgi:DNA-binding transcriptional ArsR family regulator
MKSCSSYHVFFRNLANPIKISIISTLKEKQSSVGELSKELKIEQSKLSHALASLSHCNIVQSKQEGKKRIYSLNKKAILPILKLIDNHKCEFCTKNEANISR